MIFFLGIGQPSHPTDMLSRHDGSTSDSGSAEAGRRSHGGAHHSRHDDAPAEPITDGGIRLPQSHRHAQPT